jgi:hypothetical protein
MYLLMLKSSAEALPAGIRGTEEVPLVYCIVVRSLAVRVSHRRIIPLRWH